jgi:branched-chain amino acid transport system permease protein
MGQAGKVCLIALSCTSEGTPPMATAAQVRPKRAFKPGDWIRPILAALFAAYLLWRLYQIIFVQPYLFSIGPEFVGELDRGEVSARLRLQFEQFVSLDPQAQVEVKQAGRSWEIVDPDTTYFIRSENQALNVYSEQLYGLDTWVKFAISGLILGGVYAVIALGYTLVYGILFMINFAHGDVMMLGAFAGYFALEAFKGANLLDRSILWSVISVVVALIIGMVVGMLVAIALERIAYRPLRKAPRLVPLISAIGASLFLENAAQLMFGATRHTYSNPAVIERNIGWTLSVGGRWVHLPGVDVFWQAKPVLVTYTGAITFAMSILLMVGLLLLVRRTKMGKAMRAVAEDKDTAALMGVDVDRVIGNTFAISGLLAGAAGVLWGLHMGVLYHYVGFVPGLKAFTAAVLGGVGNVAGAMLGGLSLGILEAVGPGLLGIPFQLKDVLAFSILVLVLIFRPQGLLGEVLAEKKM